MSQEEQTNLQFLDNEYAQQHYAVQAKKRREIIFRRRRLAVFFSLAAVIFVSIGISLYNDSLRLQNLERYKEETIAEQQAIKENKAALEKERNDLMAPKHQLDFLLNAEKALTE